MAGQAEERLQHLLMLQRHRQKRDEFVDVLAAKGVEDVDPLPIVTREDMNPLERLGRPESSRDASEAVGLSREAVCQQVEELGRGRGDEPVRVWFTDPDLGWAKSTWSRVTEALDSLLDADGDGIVVQSSTGLTFEIEFLPDEEANGPHELRVWP